MKNIAMRKRSEMSVKVMKRLGTLLFIVCVLIVLIPKSASAHCIRCEIKPTKKCETLKKAPSVVKIEFDEGRTSFKF